MASNTWLRTILIVRKETRCRHIGYSFRLTARVLLYAPSHRQDSTYHSLCYTSRGTLAGTGNSSMGPPHEGSIRRPIAPWADALTTEPHLAALRPAVAAQSLVNTACQTPHRQHWNRCTASRDVPLSYFSFQPVLHDWCIKGRGMCYPVCGMVHIKEPLLLIDKCSLCGGSGFPFSLSEWSLTICLTPYNRR